MCDASGELADRFHLVRLRQLGVGLLAISYVGDDAGNADRVPVFIADAALGDDAARNPIRTDNGAFEIERSCR